MKYPIKCRSIIDVTKPPYNADNTGKYDCTEALRKVFDDVMRREIEGVEKTYNKLVKLSENGKKIVYDGFENRVYNSECEEVGINVIYPEFVPSARIIYFPAGTYLVSDTITYSFDNLKNIYLSKPLSELIRGIHFMGEDSESVVIRLADNSSGFKKGTEKPVISFITVEDCLKRRCTNVSQCNTIEDITIDCGNGNEGAVGLRYMSVNSGRIQNVVVKSNGGHCGIQTARGNTASIVNVKVSGFDYGMFMPYTAVTVMDGIDVSENKIAGVLTTGAKLVCKELNSGNLPSFEFFEGDDNGGIYQAGIYYFADKNISCTEELYGNRVYYEENTVRNMSIPQNMRSENKEDWVCVDDFGASGDGKTDSTEAIQAAFNSGKPIIIFGDGHYYINGEITVPKSVKTIDFMFCDFFSGDNLVNAKGGALFNINEDSDEILFMENLYTFEQFYGHLRLIKHSAKRDLVMSDIHTQAASTYFNTVGGSKVYMDNCAATTGTYSYNCVLTKKCEYDDYSYVIPYEFHNQTVYGMQVNPERADVEMLNDNSEIMIDGYRVEGPGVAVKTINNGKTQLNICTCTIGYNLAENALFETKDAQVIVRGNLVQNMPGSEKLKFNMIIDQKINEAKRTLHFSEIKDQTRESSKVIDYYNSDEFESIQ